MMSQRFNLFYAGFTVYAPTLYFNQLEFIDICRNSLDKASLEPVIELSKHLEQQKDENNSYLKTSLSIAAQLGLNIHEQPENPHMYFDWLTHYTETVEQVFPMGRIDYYYFLYSRKIAEILCNAGLIKTYIDLHGKTGAEIDLFHKIEKCLKDNEYILFKLMAPAALLSGEPRQNYFNEFYKSLCENHRHIPTSNIQEMEMGNLKKLHKQVDEYSILVMDGFKKCVLLLKEIGF
jgi:hypothetical protein